MEQTTSVSRWRSWPASLLRSTTTEQQLWWKSVGCAPATARRRAHGTCHVAKLATPDTAPLATHQNWGKQHFASEFPSLSQFTIKRRRWTTRGTKGLCPFPATASQAAWGRTRWLCTLMHWKCWTDVKVLPTHPVTVPIQTTVTKERFCWGCRKREIKVFIGKAGRDKGTHGNYLHYHNDKHKQPVPSVLQISASAILPHTHARGRYV